MQPDTLGNDKKSAIGEFPFHARLYAAAAGVVLAESTLERALLHLRAEIKEARDRGLPWNAISAVTGRPEANLVWLLNKRSESPAEGEKETLPPMPRIRPRRSGGRGPGMSVAAYAEIKGVTRATVYSWERKGLLQSTTNDMGKMRILGTAEDMS